MKYIKKWKSINERGYLVKPFLESNEILFTEISEEDFRNRTCRSTGGEKYDEYGVFKKEELFSINDIRILNKVLGDCKNTVREFRHEKYRPYRLDKYDKSFENRPEYVDYYYIKMLNFGITGRRDGEYLITKKEDDWFYVTYMYDRSKKFWECDQIEGLLSLLREEKVIYEYETY